MTMWQKGMLGIMTLALAAGLPLKAEQTREESPRGGAALGVLLGSPDPDSKPGALIVQVLANRPAHRAGLEEGDLIIALDDQKIQEPADVVSFVQKARPGQEVNICFMRLDREEKVTLHLGLKRKERSAREGGFRFFLDDGPFRHLETLREMPRSFSFWQSGFRLGLNLMPLKGKMSANLGLKGTDGLLVLSVSGKSPAQEKGLEEGDIIRKANGKSLSDVDALIECMGGLSEKGGVLKLDVERAGKVRPVEVNIPKESGRHWTFKADSIKGWMDGIPFLSDGDERPDKEGCDACNSPGKPEAKVRWHIRRDHDRERHI